METIIGLNVDHHETCLFTKSLGGEGLLDLNKFIRETLQDAVQLVALRHEDRELYLPWTVSCDANYCRRGISVRDHECLLSNYERGSA